MTYTKFFLFALVGICLSACGSNNGENGDNKETADSTSVNNNELTLQAEPQLGELGNYLTISDPSVKFIRSEEVNGADTSIYIKSNVAITVNRAVATDGFFELEMVLLDKNHNELDLLRDYSFDIESEYDFDAQDFTHYLNTGTIRATFTKKISKKNWDKYYSKDWDKAISDGGYISLKPSSLKSLKAYGSSSSMDSYDVASDDSSFDQSTEGSTDWDEALDAYERYVDKYIAMMKKAATGDMSAVSDVDGIMKEAQTFEQKINNAKNLLTPAQSQRYIQITQKMTKM